MNGDFFDNNVDFKYNNYLNDLEKMNITYWQDDNIFNK